MSLNERILDSIIDAKTRIETLKETILLFEKIYQIMDNNELRPTKCYNNQTINSTKIRDKEVKLNGQPINGSHTIRPDSEYQYETKSLLDLLLCEHIEQRIEMEYYIKNCKETEYYLNDNITEIEKTEYPERLSIDNTNKEITISTEYPEIYEKGKLKEFIKQLKSISNKYNYTFQGIDFI